MSTVGPVATEYLRPPTSEKNIFLIHQSNIITSKIVETAKQQKLGYSENDK